MFCCSVESWIDFFFFSLVIFRCCCCYWNRTALYSNFFYSRCVQRTNEVKMGRRRRRRKKWNNCNKFFISAGTMSWLFGLISLLCFHFYLNCLWCVRARVPWAIEDFVFFFCPNNTFSIFNTQLPTRSLEMASNSLNENLSTTQTRTSDRNDTYIYVINPIRATPNANERELIRSGRRWTKNQKIHRKRWGERWGERSG